MPDLTSLLWPATIAIGLLLSVAFSAAVWWIYRTDRLAAIAARTATARRFDDVMTALTAGEEDDTLDSFDEKADAIIAQQTEIIMGLNVIGEQFEKLPERVRLSMDGALGRHKRQIKEDAAQMEVLFDETIQAEMLAQIPNPVVRGAIAKTIEARPDLAQHILGMALEKYGNPNGPAQGVESATDGAASEMPYLS